MKAAYIEQTGPADKLQYGELATPQPGASQVLVRVKAVSVNPIDTYIRAGMVPMELPMPYVVGSNLAGVVEQVGAIAGRLREIWQRAREEDRAPQRIAEALAEQRIASAGRPLR